MQDKVTWRLVIEPNDPLGTTGRKVLFCALAIVSVGIGLAFYPKWRLARDWIHGVRAVGIVVGFPHHVPSTALPRGP